MHRLRKAIVLCCIFGTAGLLLNLAVASVLLTFWSTNWYTLPFSSRTTQQSYLWQEPSSHIWEVTEYRAIGWRRHQGARGRFTDFSYDARYAEQRESSGNPFQLPSRPADWVQPAWSGYTAEFSGVMIIRGQDFEVLPSETATGWPMLAFAQQASTKKQYSTNELRIPLPYRQTNLIVPWYPIWPGVIINTMLYGLLLYSVFRLPFVLRRARRIRRGLCLRCAYDLAGLERCPECGSLKA